jgi:hypothetical protein
MRLEGAYGLEEDVEAQAEKEQAIVGGSALQDVQAQRGRRQHIELRVRVLVCRLL